MIDFTKKQIHRTGAILLLLVGINLGLSAQITVDLNITNPTCNGFTNGAATAGAFGGVEPYTYNWSSGQSGANIFGLTEGEISVTVTDADGTTAEAGAQIITPDALSGNIDASGNVCTDGSGNLTADATGGTAPYTYAWSNGANSAENNNLAEGGYFLTVTDTNGCQAVEFYEVVAPLAVTVVTTDVVCNDFCDASAEALVTGGTAPISYQWNTGMTGSVAFPLPVGTYCVTVTDGNGCTAEACGTVSAPDALEAEITLTGDCENDADVSATVGITGGTSFQNGSPYTILWNTGATGNEIINLTANTTYSVTVQDANGCSDTESITVGEVSQLALTVSGENETCAGDNDGAATVTPGGGAAPYTIQWETGSNDDTISDLAPGTYGVTVTDVNGCTGVQSVTVAAGIQIEVSTETTASLCGDTGTGSFTISPSGGMAPYFFIYENGIGDAMSGQVNDLPAGNYNVTVGDAQGCTTVTTITVDQIAEFDAQTQVVNGIICAEDTDGSATVTVGGNAAQPVTYLWDNGEMTATATALSAGTHTVTVTDANGCIAVSSVDVGAGTQVEISTEITPTDCGETSTGSFTLTPTGGIEPYTFTYQNGIGNPESGTVSGLATGDYAVTVTDAQGCAAASVVSVPEESAFTAQINEINNVSCNDAADGSATAIADGNAAEPLTYLWSNGEMTATAVALPAGTNTVTITDANGCASTASVDIATEDNVTAAFEITPADCEGTTVSLDVTSGAEDGLTSTFITENGEFSEDFTLEIETGESVTVTQIVESAAGCTDTLEQTFTAEILEAEVPTELQECLGEELTATASSEQDVTYAWTPADLFIGATDIANPTVNTSTPGIFTATVTITNETGCSIAQEVEITVTDTQIMPDPALLSQNQDCAATSVEFLNDNESADNYDYVFDFPDGETVSGGSAVDYDFGEAGVYQVALIPTVGCADTLFIEVEVAEPQTPDFTFEVDCEDGYTVTFTNTSSNPDDILDFSWIFDGEMNAAENPAVDFNEAGDIDVVLTVDYGDGCVLETTQTVEVMPFLPQTPTAQAVDCDGGGAVSLFPGANPDFTYEWSPAGNLDDPNSPNPTATVTETTVFTVTITDAETGCTEESFVELVVPESLLSPPNLVDVENCEEGNGTADATTTGGVTYTWSSDENFDNVLSNEAVFNFPVTLTPTQYFVEILDEFGCPLVESITVGAYPVEFDFGAEQSVCEGESPEIDLPDGLTVTWQNDDNPLDDVIFEDDFYVGTVTNQFNCSLTDTLFVTANDVTENLEINAEPDTILLGDQSQLTVTQDDRFTYEWDNGDLLDNPGISDPIATPGETTSFIVSITDETGCTGTMSVRVTVETNCEQFLYFPNAFTPNDDGLNDVLFVEGLSLDEVFFTIYNRWGEKVYESNSLEEGWDGTHNGDLVCPDVYGYYLRVRCTDGNEIYRQGNVSVIR